MPKDQPKALPLTIAPDQSVVVDTIVIDARTFHRHLPLDVDEHIAKELLARRDDDGRPYVAVAKHKPHQPVA